MERLEKILEDLEKFRNEGFEDFRQYIAGNKQFVSNYFLLHNGVTISVGEFDEDKHLEIIGEYSFKDKRISTLLELAEDLLEDYGDINYSNKEGNEFISELCNILDIFKNK